MTVLDLSNHDELTFNAQCLRDAGVTDVIMGGQLGTSPARRMIPQLRAVGINVPSVYAFLGFRDWWIEPTTQIIRLARDFGIERVWLDAEADDANTGRTDPSVTPEMRIARLQEAVAMVERAGLEVGIYTAEWFWRPAMQNSTAFSHLPLWLGGPYVERPIQNVSFGGWAKVAIHQYTSTFWVCGRGRDANYVFEEDNEMGMTPAEKEYVDGLAAKLARLEAIVAGHGIDTDLDGIVDKTGEDALAFAFGNGWSAFYGGALNKRAIAAHIENHPTTPGDGSLPDHVHTVETIDARTGGVVFDK